MLGDERFLLNSDFDREFSLHLTSMTDIFSCILMILSIEFSITVFAFEKFLFYFERSRCFQPYIFSYTHKSWCDINWHHHAIFMIWLFAKPMTLVTLLLDLLPGHVAQSVGHLTRKSGVSVPYPVWPHTFVSPSTDSRGAVVSYWRKYVHEVLRRSKPAQEKCG